MVETQRAQILEEFDSISEVIIHTKMMMMIAVIMQL